MAGCSNYLRRQRRFRADTTQFAVLIATPAVGEFAMPARGRIRFVSTSGSSAGDTAGTIVGSNTRTITTPVLAAAGHVVIDGVERGCTVTPDAGYTIEVDIGLGVWKHISG